MTRLEDVPFGRLPLPVVLLDANVLFQAALTRFLLGAAQSGVYRAVWTEAIAEEARRNLQASGRSGGQAAFEQNSKLLRDPIVPAAPGASLRRLSRTNAKDRHVLAAAGHCGARLIVTDNVRDFDRDEVREFGLVAATAREFAAHLARTNPAALVRHIERVPPDRYERYVALLQKLAPEAMAELRPLLDE